MSLEDLRDSYKNSRQNHDLKLKLNGATYRRVDTTFKIANMGNTISKIDQEVNKSEDLGEINKKYAIHEDGLVYSLNKKNRWRLRDDLVNKMGQFENEDTDVRLYETSNRVWNSQNLTALHTSKGDKVAVKKTYANLNSIKKRFELDAEELRNPTPAVPAEPVKSVRSKKCSKPKKVEVPAQGEKIVIELDNDKDFSGYSQYQIEYAPKKDVLKYGAKKFTRQNFAQQRKKASHDYFDDESDHYLSVSEEQSEDEETLGESSDEENLLNNKNFEVSLDDLVNKFTDSILAKRQPKVEIDVNETKDRKIYVDKSECVPHASVMQIE